MWAWGRGNLRAEQGGGSGVECVTTKTVEGHVLARCVKVVAGFKKIVDSLGNVAPEWAQSSTCAAVFYSIWYRQRLRYTVGIASICSRYCKTFRTPAKAVNILACQATQATSTFTSRVRSELSELYRRRHTNKQRILLSHTDDACQALGSAGLLEWL